MLTAHMKCALGVLALGMNLALTTSLSAHGTHSAGTGTLNLPSDPVTFYMDGSVNTFFEANLSNVPAGLSVSNGLYGSWCIDYFHPTSPTGFFQQGVLLSSLSANLPAYLQSDSWDLINYILNHKQGNRDDIQLAMWYFTDGINWGLTPTATAIINDTLANGEGFVPSAGGIVAVVFDQGENPPAQVCIIEVPMPEPEPTEPPPAEEEICEDKLTGGGWIIGPGGKKCNFGVQGGLVNGRLWGGLNYIDHKTGMHVKSRTVTSYTRSGETCRTITYDVTIDGAAGTATVVACDNGEPGRDDTFAISLSTGYSASGELGGDRNKGGGNLQLHKEKCKDKKEPKASKKNKK